MERQIAIDNRPAAPSGPLAPTIEANPATIVLATSFSYLAFKIRSRAVVLAYALFLPLAIAAFVYCLHSSAH